MQSQVASTIYSQLGGQRFAVMTGAYNFAADGQSLVFRIPQNNAKRIAGIKITLEPSDTYSVQFYAFKGSLKRGDYRVETVAQHDGIYDDRLTELFTEETGLHTSL